MNIYRYLILSIILIYVFFNAEYAFTIPIDVTCELKDINDKEVVSKVYLKLEKGKKFEFTNKEGIYKLNTPVDNNSNYQIKVDATDKFDERTLNLKIIRYDTLRDDRTIEIILINKDTPTDIKFTTLGKQYLDDSQLEKAYAIYDYAYKRIDGEATVDYYTITTKFNYAKTLYRLCHLENYNTCEKANKVFTELNDIYPQNEKRFHDAQVTKKEIEDYINERLNNNPISEDLNINMDSKILKGKPNTNTK